MKTVEIYVRFNVSVPDDCDIINEPFYLNLPPSNEGQVDGLELFGADLIPIDYSLNEYETMQIEEV